MMRNLFIRVSLLRSREWTQRECGLSFHPLQPPVHLLVSLFPTGFARLNAVSGMDYGIAFGGGSLTPTGTYEDVVVVDLHHNSIASALDWGCIVHNSVRN